MPPFRDPLGYRERRRLAKLRRRARDRGVAGWCNRWPRHEGNRTENRIEAEVAFANKVIGADLGAFFAAVVA